jgi:hypothetical protein
MTDVGVDEHEIIVSGIESENLDVVFLYWGGF